ncbi:MAG: hypothetical protein EPN84_08030 [Legionella sp.]|nr:MAG: hypothetical protein EPN84_08030 [Legionella sp.]
MKTKRELDEQVKKTAIELEKVDKSIQQLEGSFRRIFNQGKLKDLYEKKQSLEDERGVLFQQQRTLQAQVPPINRANQQPQTPANARPAATMSQPPNRPAVNTTSTQYGSMPQQPPQKPVIPQKASPPPVSEKPSSAQYGTVPTRLEELDESIFAEYDSPRSEAAETLEFEELSETVELEKLDEDIFAEDKAPKAEAPRYGDVRKVNRASPDNIDDQNQYGDIRKVNRLNPNNTNQNREPRADAQNQHRGTTQTNRWEVVNKSQDPGPPAKPAHNPKFDEQLSRQLDKSKHTMAKPADGGKPSSLGRETPPKVAQEGMKSALQNGRPQQEKPTNPGSSPKFRG